jgi:hypothetical protein
MNKNLKKALKGLSREQLQERMNYVILSTGRRVVLDWIDDVFFWDAIAQVKHSETEEEAAEVALRFIVILIESIADGYWIEFKDNKTRDKYVNLSIKYDHPVLRVMELKNGNLGLIIIDQDPLILEFPDHHEKIKKEIYKRIIKFLNDWKDLGKCSGGWELIRDKDKKYPVYPERIYNFCAKTGNITWPPS